LFDQLQSYKGKKVILELVNGRIISGTVLALDREFIRFNTDDGLGILPVNAVQIIWEARERSLTEKNMEEIAGKLRDSVKTQIACTGAQFACQQQYICRPPDICTGAFSCPFSYVPFQGGSQCPVAFACPGVQFFGFVGPSDMGTPPAGLQPAQSGCHAPFYTEAGPLAGQDDVKSQIACTSFPGFTCARSYICRPPDTCTFSFACPGSYVPGLPSGGGACPFFACRPFVFGCGPFQFGQPCGPFQFGCGPFQFGQPCGPFAFGCGPFTFGCGPFQFGGSQCGVPGGFICPGQQFIGLVGPPGAAQGTATAQPLPPLPPTELAIKQETQNKDETKE